MHLHAGVSLAEAVWEALRRLCFALLLLLGQLVHSWNVLLGVSLLLLSFNFYFLVLHALQFGSQLTRLPLQLFNLRLLTTILGIQVGILDVNSLPLRQLLLKLLHFGPLLRALFVLNIYNVLLSFV